MRTIIFFCYFVYNSNNIYAHAGFEIDYILKNLSIWELYLETSLSNSSFWLVSHVYTT